jgi:hypothetical protein
MLKEQIIKSIYMIFSTSFTIPKTMKNFQLRIQNIFLSSLFRMPLRNSKILKQLWSNSKPLSKWVKVTLYQIFWKQQFRFRIKSLTCKIVLLLSKIILIRIKKLAMIILVTKLKTKLKKKGLPSKAPWARWKSSLQNLRTMIMTALWSVDHNLIV